MIWGWHHLSGVKAPSDGGFEVKQIAKMQKKMHYMKTQQFCKTNFADFWPSDFWHPSSLDVNPLVFAMYGILEHSTNKI